MKTPKRISRRDMICNVVGGAAALAAIPALGNVAQTPGTNPPAPSAKPARRGDTIKIGRKFRWENRENEADMLYLQQIGINWIKMYWGGKDTPLSEMGVLQDRFSKYNLKIYGIARNSDPTPEGIDKFIEFIWACKKYDIPLVRTGYGEAAPVGGTGYDTRPGRNYKARIFDLEEAKKKWKNTTYVSAEAEWERFANFLDKVLPEAEKAGIQLGYHPIDPPIRVQDNKERILCDYEGYRRAELLSKGSPSWGLTFCIGCWAQGGEAMGKTPLEMIQDFGTRNKIFMVDFRNVDQPLPRFQEAFPDDGYLNMYELMKALRRVGFNGLLIPDHIPAIDGDGPKPSDMRRVGTAYSIGYIKGLLKAADDELGLS